MQNKGAIKLLAIALALVSLYQLSFTFFSNQVKKEAAEYAQGDPVKESVYLDSIASEGVYNFLGIRNYTYRECQERELNLGLDLKGGMNVTLEVSVVELIRAMSNNSTDETFNKALQLARQRQQESQKDFVTLFGEAFEELEPGAKLAAIFNTRQLKEKINIGSTNQDVLSVIRTEAEAAIENSFNILSTRINRFGVAQPNIRRLETAGRIEVELPGIKEPERVRKLLQGSANLEFWETYDNTEVFEYFSAANTRLAEILNPDLETTTQTPDTTATVEQTTDVAQETLAENTLLPDSANQDSLALLNEIQTDSATAQTTDYADKAAFAKDNPLFAVLYPNVSQQDGNLFRGAAVGTAHFKDTAKVNEYLQMKEIKELFPRDIKLLWEVKPVDYKTDGNFYQLIALKVTTRDGTAPLGGDVITDARAEFGQNQATAEVTMAMNGEGAKKWARMTKDNVNRQIAIVLDNLVYSYPNVNSEIRGGRSSITGNFSIQEAKDLANVLKSGKLPAPAKIIEEDVVGPSLGQEAISAGMISFIIAFVVVLIYMLFWYKGSGIVADIALIVNVFFIFGVLASLGAVLTLPGIAGIVLTIGMSVDANVLIFERIKEELALGKGIKLAVSDGYKNAYSAIIDANVTTFLTGMILYIFGHGPIQGFATTLMIGIGTSLFAAIFITRLVFLWQLDKNREISFASKLTQNAFKNLNINFIDKRKIGYVISGTLIIVSIVSLAVRGLNYGVDFTGGRTYVVQFKNDVNTVEVAEALRVVYGESPEVKTFGAANQVKITTKYMIDSEEENADLQVEQKLYEGLKPMIDDNLSKDEFLKTYRQSSKKVGPTIADDIMIGAFWAIFFSLVIIFLYILIRFRNWQYGLGAVTALIHDALVVLGIFSLLKGVLPFSLEIDQAFIAAILTVVGYSINDTVVVFDRIRENTLLHKGTERKIIFNDSLNSTLSRTFSTSLSTFVVLLAIFIFGGEVIRGFIFALMVGVVVGTYSSLYVATPVVFDSQKEKEKKQLTDNRVYKGGKKVKTQPK